MKTQFDYARLKDLIETTKYFDNNDNEYKNFIDVELYEGDGND